MTNSSRAINSLLKIMNTDGALTRRRIEAAEAVLLYEAPEAVVEQTKSFLTTVFESEQVDVSDRLEALRLMRKAEAPRVAQQTIRAANTDKDRELWRDIEIAARRMKLDRAGLWPPATPDWADDLLGDDYVPPVDRTIDSLFDD